MPNTPESLAALPLSLAGHSVVVGLGATGLSCARFLSRMGASFSVVDSREAPPALSEFKTLFPGADVYLGSLESAAITPVLEGADRLIVSPGVAVSSPAIARAKVKGVKILGDIALFAEFAPAPILAVTGSNGKSTVVALLAAMLRAAGKDFGLGGNLDGAQFKPALDLLEESPRSIYLLELSSFQLETTDELNAFAVALLNLSEDHMDRYSDSAEYLSAKQKIFCAAKHAVVNSGNPLTLPPSGTLKQLAYSVDGPANEGLGINEQGGERFLALNGESFLPVAELKQAGSHDLANALAATGLALLAGVSIEAVCAALRSFEGLPTAASGWAKLVGFRSTTTPRALTLVLRLRRWTACMHASPLALLGSCLSRAARAKGQISLPLFLRSVAALVRWCLSVAMPSALRIR